MNRRELLKLGALAPVVLLLPVRAPAPAENRAAKSDDDWPELTCELPNGEWFVVNRHGACIFRRKGMCKFWRSVSHETHYAIPIKSRPNLDWDEINWEYKQSFSLSYDPRHECVDFWVYYKEADRLAAITKRWLIYNIKTNTWTVCGRNKRRT